MLAFVAIRRVKLPLPLDYKGASARIASTDPQSLPVLSGEGLFFVEINPLVITKAGWLMRDGCKNQL